MDTLELTYKVYTNITQLKRNAIYKRVLGSYAIESGGRIVRVCGGYNTTRTQCELWSCIMDICHRTKYLLVMLLVAGDVNL